jgi:multidrug efflux pump subunit AcrA (membrane-fusion protein)
MVTEGKPVKKGEMIVQLESETIENNYLTADNEYEIARAEAEKRQTELDLERLLLESQVKSLSASVAISRLRLNDLTFEPVRRQEIERLEIEKNEIDLKKIENKLAALESIQKEERLRFQLKIKQEKSKRDQAKEHLNKLKLFAPVDGILVYAKDWWGNKVKEGDEMYARRPIAEIPDLRIMQLKLKLGETAAQKCKEGQKAEISSHAFNGGVLTGKVSRVNRIAKPIHRKSKVKKVEVLVELDSSGISITPGISARGKIFITDTQETYALPHECIFNKDSLKLIYVRDGSKFEPRAIKIDLQSEEFVLIHSGLSEGEELAFQEPSKDEVEWPESFSIPIETNMKTDSTKSQDDQGKI